MALQAAYKQFLAAPNTSFLADDASLHYITSTTSFRGATEILKHLSSVRNQIKKKKEDLLHVVEGQNAIAAEVDTAFEFLTSGGPYLPGLDDNFLADRTVYLPMVHMVSFNAENKITTIRQSWDQGSLLKQLDVIGKTGRNWPIRDSTEQLRLIKTSQNAAGVETARPAEPAANRSRKDSNNILRDPHASLALFAPREEADAPGPSVVSPYAGRRPRQRSFTEILGDEPVEEPGTPTRERSMSPTKAIAPKGGAAKNYQPSRLFEAEEEPSPEQKIPERKAYYKPNEKKFQHFDFSDGSDAHPQEAPRGKTTVERPKSKHDSNWSFDDFSTPAKALPTRGLHRTQDERHWSNDDDTVTETPVKKPAQPKPRRDAEAHFEFRDDGEPGGEPRLIGRPRGTGHNTGLGLYEQNLYSEDGSKPSPAPARPLGNITNLEDRRKDFAPHFEMKDYSPAHGQTQEAPKVGEDRKKAVKMMESNWSALDEPSVSQKENNAPTNRNGNAKANRNVDDRGITIAGDGMGGRKGGQHWAIGDDDDQQTRSEEVPGKKQGVTQPTSGAFWDF
ncbi:hypothetical protein CONLIGDRAFT_567839 [Coniochaeta ligniaria NRRL 30616]|uniref:NTF2-like protein n=1 Tax=Coniochaeta ligniaria NRRL 30616 TaxID=1408157 RepID=A0A1J7J6M1_9PEZI|nr:hypothetical protein CONLIGDRAFT_567839 [Coniochaeta ligniaria NRRL 30616]